MKSDRFRTLLVSVGASSAICLLLYLYVHPGEPKVVENYVLPNDDFDQAAMNQIWADVNQYNVAQTPQDHEVYIVSGGLGMANPQFDGWDSLGNMNFGRRPGNYPMFAFQEMAQSPATWQMQRDTKGTMTAEGNSTSQDGFTPVPWVQKYTKTGRPYFEWDMYSGLTQFYFKEGQTFIVVRVDSPSGNYSFPEGIMSHLLAVGNPVKHRI